MAVPEGAEPVRSPTRPDGRRGACRPLAVAALVLALSSAAAARAQGTHVAGLRSVRTGGIAVETAALVMSGQEGGRIPLEGLAVPLRSAGLRTQVLLVIEAAGEALTPEAPGAALGFDVVVYALAGDGALAGTLIQSFEIDTAVLGQRLRETGVKFVGDLVLPAGSYRLRVMVRCPASGDVGLRTLPVEVPDGGSSPALLVLDETDDAWIVARETGSSVALLPAAARPVLALGREAALRLFDPIGDTDTTLPRVTLGGTGQAVELAVRVAAPGVADEGFRILAAALPGALQAGAYRLRAVLDRQGAELTSPALPVVLVPPPAADSDPWTATWPHLGKVPLQAAVAARQETRDAADDLGERALRAGLDEVFQALASGDDAGARRRLWALVSPALGASDGQVLERAEARSFRAVGDARPAGLGPVMLLYDWLYRHALEKRQTAVSTHARTTILKLVQLFLKSSGDGFAPERQAAQMLACLGGRVQQAGLVDLSDELFRRALALDAGNEATILALAAGDERVGEHEAAAAHLTDLLEVDPGHGQARLRAAVNLVRVGRRKAARHHLESLLAGRHERWLLSLAYQELVKLHLSARRLEAAREVLQTGIRRLPQDEKLHLQLAFVYDALARPDESLAVLARLDLPRPERESSPRHRYTLWPTAALARTRSALIATAETQRADLAAALGLPPAEAHAP